MTTQQLPHERAVTGRRSAGDGQMLRILLAGLALAVLAGVLVAFGDDLGLDLQLYALFGLAIGGAVGLAAGHPLAKAAGFFIGFVVAWAAYGLRAAVLPDTSTGRAISAVLVVLVLTAIAAPLRSRALYVAEFLGVAALAGAYETTFNTLPSAFLTTSVVAATTVLFAAALGYLGSELIGSALLDGDDDTKRPPRTTPPPEDSAGFKILDRSNSEA